MRNIEVVDFREKFSKSKMFSHHVRRILLKGVTPKRNQDSKSFEKVVQRMMQISILISLLNMFIHTIYWNIYMNYNLIVKELRS